MSVYPPVSQTAERFSIYKCHTSMLIMKTNAFLGRYMYYFVEQEFIDDSPQSYGFL